VLIPGAIKTKKSQSTESQRNKNVLSSRLNSVRQMSCLTILMYLQFVDDGRESPATPRCGVDQRQLSARWQAMRYQMIWWR